MEPEGSLPHSQVSATCPYQSVSPGPRLSLWTFCNKICFYSEELLAPLPTPKLEDHLLSAARDCLFKIFADTLLIGGRSTIRNLATRHPMVTGTHLPRYVCENNINKQLCWRVLIFKTLREFNVLVRFGWALRWWLGPRKCLSVRYGEFSDRHRVRKDCELQPASSPVSTGGSSPEGKASVSWRWLNNKAKSINKP